MVEFGTWHADGTELALDGLFPTPHRKRLPRVWEKTGHETYTTAHPAFEYDDAGVNIVAIFIERLQATIDKNGDSFEGTFTWGNYDFQGNLLPGSVTGARIQVGSPFPFPFPL